MAVSGGANNITEDSKGLEIGCLAFRFLLGARQVNHFLVRCIFDSIMIEEQVHPPGVGRLEPVVERVDD